MSMSDPLADMVTRIRNAGMVLHKSVDMPLSSLKLGVTKILKQEGYIDSFDIVSDNKQGMLKIDLKYDQVKRRAISGIRRISKPGRRIYVQHDNIPKVMSGLGISIISSSKGIITDRDARRLKIGGEVLCEVW